MTRNQRRREYMTEYKRKYRAAHPLVYKAHQWVRNEVRAGRMKRLPRGMQYHHPDYRRPGFVVPCRVEDHRKCHKK